MISLPHRGLGTPMRPNHNKDMEEMEVTELERLFAEYVETDMLHQINGPIPHRSSSNSLTPHSEVQTPIRKEKAAPRYENRTWHKAEEKWDQSSALPIEFSDYIVSPDPKTRDSYSDSELLNIEDLFELQPNQLRSVSHPPTPRPRPTKIIKKAVSFTDCGNSRGIQKQPKVSAASSLGKMSQSAFLRPCLSNLWSRNVDTTFNSPDFTDPFGDIRSPPSTKLSQNETSVNIFSKRLHSPHAALSPRGSPDLATSTATFSNYQLTPQASPAIGVPDVANDFQFGDMGLGISSSSASSTALSALQTPPSSVPIPMTAWGSDASQNLDFAFSTSPEYSHTKTADWWDPDLMQPTAGSTHREANTRAASQNSAFQASSDTGLGICDTGNLGQLIGLRSLEDDMTMLPGSASSFNMDSYGLYPVLPAQNLVSIGHRSLSRTPSPCPQPRFHRRRPSSHTYNNYPRTSSSHRRKSSNGGLSAQSTSRQSSSGSGGFVNFTPDDSRKILTGVAPSGSSKTKARREKEAAEKRRKITQAAAQAIIAAGGDLSSLRGLEMEGSLAMESGI